MLIVGVFCACTLSSSFNECVKSNINFNKKLHTLAVSKPCAIFFIGSVKEMPRVRHDKQIYIHNSD